MGNSVDRLFQYKLAEGKISRIPPSHRYYQIRI